MFQYLFRQIRRSNRGQSATEYMLILAVVVIGLLAAASKLVPMFREGVTQLGQTITSKYLSNAPDFCDPSNDGC